MSDTILVSDSGGLRTITLNRPERLNAFTTEMLEAFNAALNAASREVTVRAVLITGAGRGFCAGQDLNDRLVAPGTSRPDLGETLNSYYNPAIRLMRTMSKPVVVSVNGVAAGAGATVALAGDIVIAARSAHFILSFSKLGLIPDSGGTFVLPRLVGAARAMGLAMLGRPLTAEVAAAWGLIWKVCDDGDLAAEVSVLAASLATGPTAAFARLKVALDASIGNDLDTQLDLERDLQRAAGWSDDYQEGVDAFMEKRQPRFGGQ